MNEFESNEYYQRNSDNESNELKIIRFLQDKNTFYCDDCLAKILDFNSRQNPNQVCNKSNIIKRIEPGPTRCSNCNKNNKILRYVENLNETDFIQNKTFQEVIDNKITQFKKSIKQYKKQETQLFEKRIKFVNDFTAARIVNLDLNEYVIGLQEKNTFCYRLETELNDLGNIHGSNASKFGIYYGEKGDDTERKFRFTKKFGKDVDSAFIAIKQEICALLAAGNTKDYETICNSKFAPLVRGKILFVYYPESFLNIFSNEHLEFFLDVLKISYNKKDDTLFKQDLLINWKNSQETLKDLDLYLFSLFLYESFGQPLKEAEIKNEQEKEYDKQYPKDYFYKIAIDKDDWKELIKNSEIFYNNNLEVIKKIYLSQHHANTCSELAEIEGVHPTSYIKPIIELSKRILNEMGLTPLKRKNSEKSCYWPVLFWGRYTDKGLFEWKLRPDLVKAIKEIFPEWDKEKSDSIADDKLIEDLKDSSFAGADVNFEYSGKPKEKAEPFIVDGHKTFPRDRKVAINALSKANFTCECNNAHTSFISRKSNKRYMEPHHLIPLAYSDRFEYSLDIEENIVSLCSNCHNEIHYGTESLKMVKQLFKKRKALLEKAGIEIEEETLLEMYK